MIPLLLAMLSAPNAYGGDLGVYKNGECGLWKEKYVAGARLGTGATGGTVMLYSTSPVLIGTRLDATTEYVYFALHIDAADWDSTSNPVIKVNQLLENAETAGDDLDSAITCEYGATSVDWDTPKTQTRTVAHDMGATVSAGQNVQTIFVLDRAAVDNAIVAGDRMYCGFHLTDVGAGHVASVIVLEIDLYYRTCYPAEPVGTFPVEG
jgi:hypothetical protein